MEIIHRTLKTAANYFENFFIQEKIEAFLTYVDARVKLPFFISLVVITVLSQNIKELIFPFFAFFSFYILSGIHPKIYFKKVYLITFFSFLVVLPHIFLTSLNYVIIFTLRVYLSISFLVIFSLTTPFQELLKALKFYRIPDTLILVIASTYTHIYILFKEMSRILLAKESRKVPSKNYRKIWKENSSGVLGPFFVRVYEKGERVNLAMISRGFNGKFNLVYIEKKRFNTYVFMVIGLCLMILWLLFRLSVLII